MPLTFTAPLRQWVTRWLVCLLSACLPLQGVALVSERIHGAAHVHIDAAAATAPVAAPVHAQAHPDGALTTLPVGAQDTVWSPTVPVLLDMASLRHSHGAPRLLAPAPAELALPHHHDEVAHHLHDPADATVLSLDDAPSPADTSAAGASKRLMLDVDGPPAYALRQADTPPKPPQIRLELTAWAQVPGDRLERPPRSAQR